MSIRTILCPVDFSPASRPQVDLAAALARAFGARLILHHNIAMVAPGMGVGWMWAADHHPESEHAVADKLASLPAGISDVDIEMKITTGAHLPSVMALGTEVDADLIILSTHGVSTLDHTSITEQILKWGNRALLVLHGTGADGGFMLTSDARPAVVVPTDLASEAGPDIAFAVELARTLPVELHLLHLLPKDRHARPDLDMERACEHTRRLVPSDLATRVVTEFDRRDPVDGIIEAAARLSAACIVMDEGVRAARRVLHESRCPVWYVPRSSRRTSAAVGAPDGLMPRA